MLEVNAASTFANERTVSNKANRLFMVNFGFTDEKLICGELDLPAAAASYRPKLTFLS